MTSGTSVGDQRGNFCRFQWGVVKEWFNGDLTNENGEWSSVSSVSSMVVLNSSVWNDRFWKCCDINHVLQTVRWKPLRVVSGLHPHIFQADQPSPGKYRFSWRCSSKKSVNFSPFPTSEFQANQFSWVFEAGSTINFAKGDSNGPCELPPGISWCRF